MLQHACQGRTVKLNGSTRVNSHENGFYFCFGEYDGAELSEVPDDTNATALRKQWRRCAKLEASRSRDYPRGRPAWSLFKHMDVFLSTLVVSLSFIHTTIRERSQLCTWRSQIPNYGWVKYPGDCPTCPGRFCSHSQPNTGLCGIPHR